MGQFQTAFGKALRELVEEVIQDEGAFLAYVLVQRIDWVQYNAPYPLLLVSVEFLAEVLAHLQGKLEELVFVALRIVGMGSKDAVLVK